MANEKRKFACAITLDALVAADCFFDALGSLIIVLDKKGKIRLFNSGAEELLGYDSKEVIGKDWINIFVPKNIRPQVRAVFQDLMSGKIEVVESYVNDILAKDGSVITAQWHSSLITAGDGSIEGTLASATNITELKENKDRLELNKNRLESIIELIDEPFVSEKDFLDKALNRCLEITESKFGYIYKYSEETKEFELNTWSKGVMEKCKIVNPKTKYQLLKTGVWGEVVRQRKTIMINDFQAPNKLKKGYPRGHVKLHNFLTTPLFEDRKIVAVVGLGNKKTDYNQDDIDQVKLLMTSVWNVLKEKKTAVDLEEKIAQMEKLNSLMIGRELRMVELKEELSQLKNGRSKNEKI